jgi:uncharacterized protein with von Willebrand factor type A (vWA) domain
VILDQSGSMKGARALWAGALAVAVLLEAHADGRHVAVVTFSGAVRSVVVVDSAVTMHAALTAVLMAPAGGTCLRPALDAAAAALGRMRKSGDPADVLLITDGDWQANALASWTSDAARRARLRGVFVGGAAPEGSGLLDAWSVDVDAADPAAAVTIARTIV